MALLSDPEALGVGRHPFGFHLSDGQASTIKIEMAYAVFIECLGAVEVQGAAGTLVVISSELSVHCPKGFLLGGMDIERRAWASVSRNRGLPTSAALMSCFAYM